MPNDTPDSRPTPPGEFIRDELRQRGWSQEDLAHVLGRSTARVSQLITGKQELSPEIALALEAVFGMPAAGWLAREACYRLSLAGASSGEVQRRARLHSLAPVKELQKRGWLPAVASDDDIERHVLRYFGIGSLEEEPLIHGAMRKTNPVTPPSPAQRAWAFRVRQIAAAVPASATPAYDESKLAACKQELRKLAAYSAEVRKVPALMQKYGIRLVVVEGLPGAKMDGFATWLDDASPVIGLSLRYDRLNSFWHTLGHELIHIDHRDLAPIDGDLDGEDDLHLMKSPMERRADAESNAIYINPADLDSFVRRVGPLYSTERINQFANTIKMHPNIIVGQLKGRGEIGPSKHNKTNTPVREAVVKAAVTDGWGKSFHPGVLS